MSYGEYPYDGLFDPLYESDRWEKRYADFLDQQMEAQYHAELATQLESIENESNVATQLESIENESNVTTQLESIENESNDIPHQILHLPMEENDVHAHTVGEYLGLLLSTLWQEADGFSGKRPFGNSDWQYDVYKALGKAGLVEILLDEDGYIEEFSADEEYKADELILQAIRFAYNH